MPPKKVDKKTDKGQAKALEKQKIKVAEDKTFGLKNKNKSKSVQKFIKGVQNAAKGNAVVSDSVLRQQETAQKEEKKKQAQQAALMAALFKGTENIKKIALDDTLKSDPTSIKQGQLIDVYVDQRDQKGADTMDTWDLKKLEEVVKTKHGAHQIKGTEIVCKHFLDALEKRQYGWFWSCPSGGDECKYRHCLPPGYVLKRDLPPEEINEDDIEPLEDIIERERAELKGEGTKITLESFKAWKAQKEKERLEGVEAARVAEQKKTGGRGLNVMSGRDLFSYDPTLFIDDAAAADEGDYEEDDTYWQQVLNANQAAVDKANEDALNQRCGENLEEEDLGEESSGDDQSEYSNSDNQNDATSVSSFSAKNPTLNKKGEIVIGRDQLFLEGEEPDLDEIE